MGNRLWSGLEFLSRRNSSCTADCDSDGEATEQLERTKSGAKAQTLGSMKAWTSSSSSGSSNNTTAQQQQSTYNTLGRSSSPAHGAAVSPNSNNWMAETSNNHGRNQLSSGSSLSSAAASTAPTDDGQQQQQQQQHELAGSHEQCNGAPQTVAMSANPAAQPQATNHESGSSMSNDSNHSNLQVTFTPSSVGRHSPVPSAIGANAPESTDGEAVHVSATSLVSSAGHSGPGSVSSDDSGAAQPPPQQQQQQQLQEDPVVLGQPGVASGGGSKVYDPSTDMFGSSSGGANAGAMFDAPTPDQNHHLTNMQAAPEMTSAGLMINAGGAAGAQPLQQLLAELQREAGLNEQQAASAAALLQRYSTNAAAAPAGYIPPVYNLNLLMPSNPSSQAAPVWQAGLSPSFPHIPLSPSGPFCHSLTAGSTPLMTTSNPAMNATVTPGGGGGGLESGRSSASTNAQSGAGSDGGVGKSVSFNQGLMENMFSSPDMVYGADGLDTLGTAQVAVHNVPFKWCNHDLEALFKQLPGYLDAQLLFHDNGRSKGVGVVLFSDRTAASEAVNKLTGAQADGRKLELVLMNPDNHISFSCRQVAVLGLPWEYTAADVRALIEAAAEADGETAADAGVEAVEVAYREDGKSEGRAIATFRSRHQAHTAIGRLHGRETLAGLRMRLFYLHEQQQRQHLLAHTPQSLLASMVSLDSPSPAFAAASATVAANNGLGVIPGDASAASGAGPGAFGLHGFGAQATYSSLGSVEGDLTLATLFNNASNRNSGEQQQQQQGADGPAGAPAGSTEGQSARSSFDKDQGPVILHVSGLMESVSREQLRELFSQAGEVTKVDIPDGGRSMGYGFITFSNPQAAEQAMLLFNNYPLGGGAIHVAYSTSATAKARQQALRQARKATLGARVSMDGDSSGAAAAGSVPGQAGHKPSTPRGSGPPVGGMSSMQAGPGSFGGNRGRGGLPFEDGLPGSVGGVDPVQNPVRHSFDHPGYSGYTSPGGPGYFRNRAVSATAGLGVSPAGLGPESIPALSPGGFGAGRGRHGGFGSGAVPPLASGPLQHMQMLQAAGGNPAAAAAAAAAAMPAGVSSALEGLSMEQLQLLIQAGGDVSVLGPGMSQGTSGFGLPGGLAYSGVGSGLRLGGGAGRGGPAGLFQPPGTPPNAGLNPAGGLLGSTGPAGFLNPALGSSVPLQQPGSGLMFGVGGAFGSMAAAGAEQVAVPPSTQVLVTGLPAGLDELQLRNLFELCGRLQGVSNPADKDYVLVSFESVEGAVRAVQVLNNTYLPGSGNTINVQFAPMLGPPGAEAPTTPAQPSGEFRPPGSATGSGLGLFGGESWSTPHWPLAHQISHGSVASGVGESAAGGGSAGGSGSLWAAPDAASGLSASSVGGFDANLRLRGHASPVPAGVSAPWDSAAVAALAMGGGAGGGSGTGIPGSPMSQGRPPFPGLYHRAVGSSRPAGDPSAGAAFFGAPSPLRSNSPVGGAAGAGPSTVYASPLYQASTMLGSAGDLLGKVASSSALVHQSLSVNLSGAAGAADFGSSGNLHQAQQQQQHLLGPAGIEGGAAAPVEELPSSAVAAAWGDLSNTGPGAAAGGSVAESARLVDRSSQ